MEGVACRDRGTQPCDRLCRLRDMDDAARHDEVDVVACPRPVERGIPALALERDQRGRMAGAVAEQIGLRIACQPGGEGRDVGRDTIDRGVGEPGQRHRAGIDHALDGAPFLGDGIGKRVGRQRQVDARRRLERATIEPNAAIDDRDVAPEAFRGRHRGVRHRRARIRGTRIIPTKPITISTAPKP